MTASVHATVTPVATLSAVAPSRVIRRCGGVSPENCSCHARDRVIRRAQVDHTFGDIPIYATSRGDGLVVGDPADPLEREADAMATTALSGDAAAPVVRRHASSHAADVAAGRPAPAIVGDVLRSPGAPLDAATRASFGARFGHDFSEVRVHTGARATESARAIQSLAYTVGQHIVFDAGRYSPATDTGRTLLGHELAHVVQQGATTTIRRAAPPVPTPPTVPTPAAGPSDFEIRRVGASTKSEIFFEKGSAALTAQATIAINAIKAAKPPSVKLVGNASRDEPASIAQQRADAVKTALTTPPDPVTVTSAVGNAAATSERLEFTEVRHVEVLAPAAPPTTLDCSLKNAAGLPVNPPKAPCTTMDPPTWTAFGTAWPVAKQAMDEAKKLVNAPLGPANIPLIDKFFGKHDAPTMTTLQNNVARLKDHVDNLDKITQCGGQCDVGLCAGGSTIAYNDGVDAGSTMTLCVPTFKGMAVNDAARNLVHESAHGTTPLGGPAAPGEGTKDVAYRHERMMFQLSTADRLRNSDSYALFALFAREVKITGIATAVPTGISTPHTDTPVGLAAPEEPPMKLALARLEKRLTWAEDWTSQLYSQAIAVSKGTQTWAASWAEDLMTQAAKWFPLTAPKTSTGAATKPSADDLIRLAAIHERFDRMHIASKRDLTITKVAAGVAKWNVGTAWIAGASLEVGPDFFKATPDNQVSLLLQQLALATKDVEPTFRPAYVALAAWIHSKNP